MYYPVIIIAAQIKNYNSYVETIRKNKNNMLFHIKTIITYRVFYFYGNDRGSFRFKPYLIFFQRS